MYDSKRWLSGLMLLALVSVINAHERPPFEVVGVNERYELVVPVVTTPPTVDGTLDDPVWREAAKAQVTRQVAPLLGHPASLPTTVLVLATADKLFFGFRCAIAHKDAIRAYETRYDAPMGRDERVTVFLDTLHTHDRVYEFTVNARGTRADARFGNGRWDAQWEAAVKVGETEWTAEIAVPLGVFTYDPRQTVWGVNFGRFISDREEWTLWAFNPDRPWDGRYMPHLVGLPLAHQRRNAAVPRGLLKAFGVVDYAAESGSGFRINSGVDGEWAPRPNMALRFVVKPDFSEVAEAFESIDVSYVEQFVPDQREFFVQGGEFFGEVAPTLFFSRRIGEFDAGLKLTGTVGRSQIGALTTHNFGDREHTVVLNTVHTFGLRGRGYLGYVNALRSGASHQGLVVGGEWRFGPRLRYALRTSYARHLSPDPQRRGETFSLRLSYGDERWFAATTYTATSPSFRPLLGYVPRTDFKRWSFFVEHTLRPNGDAFYRELEVSTSGSWGETFAGAFFERNLSAHLNLTLRDRTEISLSWSRNRHAEYHLRPEPFNDRAVRLELDFGGNRPFRGDIGYAIGHAFDGRYRQPYLALRWDSPDGRWRARLELSQRTQTFGDGTRQTVQAQEISLTRVLDADRWLVLRYYHRRGDFVVRNFALSFRIKRSSGEELYLIIGDPRARQTRMHLALKWIMPLAF